MATNCSLLGRIITWAKPSPILQRMHLAVFLFGLEIINFFKQTPAVQHRSAWNIDRLGENVGVE